MGFCLWFCTGINNFGVIKTATLGKIKSFFHDFLSVPISGQRGLEKILSALKPFLLFLEHAWVTGTREPMAVSSLSSPFEREEWERTGFSSYVPEEHGYLVFMVSDL